MCSACKSAAQPCRRWGSAPGCCTYSIASNIYRVFIGILIMVLVAYKVPMLGVLMAIGGLATWLIVPLVQLTRYLLLDPELQRKRRQAIAFSVTVGAAIVILIGLVPFPMHIEFTGVVQPDDPTDASGIRISGTLKTSGEGRVVNIDAHDGDVVQSGQVILEMTDADVQHDLEVARPVCGKLAEMRKARVTDLNELTKTEAEMKAWQDKLADAEQRQDKLKIHAPFTGHLIAPELHELQDDFLPRGQEIGTRCRSRQTHREGQYRSEGFPAWPGQTRRPRFAWPGMLGENGASPER